MPSVAAAVEGVAGGILEVEAALILAAGAFPGVVPASVAAPAFRGVVRPFQEVVRPFLPALGMAQGREV